jgi:hypothetical protein
MDNVPVRVGGPASVPRTDSPNSGRKWPSAGQNGNPKRNILKPVLIALGSLIVLAIFVLASWSLQRNSVGAQIDNGKYQAVFFTNGQVYFGKLEKLSGGYFKLNNIYYLQAPTTEDSENLQATTAQQAADVQLIKLGSEVHGPEDSMVINEDQILFFENLKADGKVTTSIGEYISQKK